MGQLGQTITVVNKSGVVVKNVRRSPPSSCCNPRLTSQIQSKQLINVFKEAKNAYAQRKAELKSNREADDERRTRKALRHLDLDDGVSRSSSRRSRNHHHHRQRGERDHERPSPPRSHRSFRDDDGDSFYAPRAVRPPMDRGYTDSFYVNEAPPLNPDAPHHSQAVRRRPIPQYLEQDLAGDDFHRQEMQRRHSDYTGTPRLSDPYVDMDLAYGELPPPLPVRRMNEENEMRGEMTKLTRLLEEANCLQYSATTTISHLQKNPDALAAVALSLAQASNLARKMAPGALMAMKGTFPAAMALLASPQFLIAGGLAIGVTVVMLGGYKIIKRIQDQKKIEQQSDEPARLQQLEPELSGIEVWRRGIADAEAESVGTIVEGEFVTPMASQRLMDEGRLRPENIRAPSETSRQDSERRRSRRSGRDDNKSRAGSERPRGGEVKRSGTRRAVVSGVKMLFKGRSAPEGERRQAQHS